MSGPLPTRYPTRTPAQLADGERLVRQQHDPQLPVARARSALLLHAAPRGGTAGIPTGSGGGGTPGPRRDSA